VKIENTDKKFDATQVNATKEGKTDVVKEIELGGSIDQARVRRILRITVV